MSCIAIDVIYATFEILVMNDLTDLILHLIMTIIIIIIIIFQFKIAHGIRHKHIQADRNGGTGFTEYLIVLKQEKHYL